MTWPTGPLDQPGPWQPRGAIAVADSDLAGEPATIADRVSAGVAWLDEHDPTWWREDAAPVKGVHDSRPIDLDRLDLSDPCGCVAGHRWGHFIDAPFESAHPTDLGMLAAILDERVPLSVGVGEFRARRDAEYNALTFEWRRVIWARRAEVTGDG